MEFDSIFDIDFDMLEEDDYICLKTDYNIQKNFWQRYGTEKGAIYTKGEAKLIKSKLEEIISQINVPPEGIKDREKIVYTQIVQHLAQIMQYDFEGCQLIDKYREIYYVTSGGIDEEDERRIDVTQNLKGLIDGKSVCKGKTTIINALTQYFGISSKSICNQEHAWNLVTLDGEIYEDDFTWYINELKSGTLPKVQTFLSGRMGKQRAFDALKFHDTQESLDLAQSISLTEKINLLATDWSTIQNWQGVDIKKANTLDTFMNQLDDFAKKIEITLKLALKKGLKFMQHEKGEEHGRER